MKVLICPAQMFLSDRHGSEFAYPLHFARRLQNRGHRVHLVVGTSTVPSTEALPIASVFNQARGSWGGFVRTLVFPWSYSSAAEELLSARNFDLVHHFLPFGEHTFNPLAWRSVSQPLVLGPIQLPALHYSVEFSQWLGSSSDPVLALAETGLRIASPLLRAMNRATLSRVTALVASNSASLGVYARFAPRSRQFVIPIGVDTEHFRPLDMPRGDERFEFLFVGRLIPRKGIDILIEAFHRVYVGEPSVRLTIIGSGPLERRLVEVLRQRGLESVVRLIGRVHQAELPNHYAAADVVVNPTVYEPFSTVNLEAMACGCPVVSTTVVGMEELVPPNAGRLVPPRDAVALADAMESMLNDREGLVAMSASARDHVVNNYSWDRVASQWENVYLEALARGGDSASSGAGL
jgi:glycosyltransferase involved in cell wall biosynthesis